MNILSCIIPKADVATLDGGSSIRAAIHKMSHYHYTSIPVLGSQGHYLYAISTGDILFYLQENDMTLKQMEDIPLEQVPIYRPVMAMSISSTPNEIIEALFNQNYVPMVDERGIFIGIITRKRFAEAWRKEENDP